MCRVQITAKGRSLVSRIHGELVKEHEQVLKAIAPENREAVIDAVTHLLTAFRQRQGQCASVKSAGRPRGSKTG